MAGMFIAQQAVTACQCQPGPTASNKHHHKHAKKTAGIHTVAPGANAVRVS
jgi:hypothetical protein